MSVFTRKYNLLLVAGTTAIEIPMIKRGLVDYAVGADWTPAAGDVKIDLDGAGPTNVTNLPTAVASGNGAYWRFILTAAELSGKKATVTIVDAATKAVEDNGFIVETFGNASAMYQADLSAANLPADIKAWLASTPNALQSGRVDSYIGALASGVIAAASFASGALDAVWSTTARTLSATGIQGIWDALTSALTTSGSVGKRIADDLDATVSSRSTYAGGAVASVTAAVTVGTNNDKTGYALSSGGVQAIWDALTSALTTANSIGKRLADDIDATISSRGTSTYAGGDTSGTTTLLSRLSATRAGYLDNLSAGAAALEASLQALITTVGTAGVGLTAAGLTAAGVRTAVGLGSANLDTQLAAIAAYVDTEVAAIKAKTDNLPSDPADASDIAASFSSLASTLATIASYIDTEVAAIKAKTDQMSFMGGILSAALVLRTGTAQGGSNSPTTITLDAGASSVDNFYGGAYVAIVSGAGAGQTPIPIVFYDGTTKVATGTGSASWIVPPDNTSVFVVYGSSSVDVRNWVGVGMGIPTIDGYPDVTVSNWKDDVAPDMTGDAYARLGAPAGASIAADLAEILAETDDIAAIKAKTDSLAFTVPGQVDSNPKSINDAALTGDGDGTPWGPA